MILSLRQSLSSKQGNTAQADTIALLRQMTEETAVALQALEDEQLEKTTSIPLAGGNAFSGEWVMQAFAISHAEYHLKAIKTTIGVT